MLTTKHSYMNPQTASISDDDVKLLLIGLAYDVRRKRITIPLFEEWCRNNKELYHAMRDIVIYESLGPWIGSELYLKAKKMAETLP